MSSLVPQRRNRIEPRRRLRQGIAEEDAHQTGEDERADDRRRGQQTRPAGDRAAAALIGVEDSDFAGDSYVFTQMLRRMLVVSGDGHDHLMDYTQAVTGAHFFAPSLETLASLETRRSD